jgi:hypothetical protein
MEKVNMEEVVNSRRKSILIRGFQVLVIGVMFNLGITVLAFLALIQFFWMLITQEKNGFISDIGMSLKSWFGSAVEFMLGTRDLKPFPWSKP